MTAKGFTTCLWFDGQAEEAANFYVSVFKDSSLGDTLHHTESSPGSEGNVLTVEFVLNGQRFVALNGGPDFQFSEAISFEIDCENQAEVDHYWDKLVEGGGEHGPCGWLKDRYGVSWQVTPIRLTEMLKDPDRTRADRVMKAMMQMHKLDIAELEKAYAGE
ncbi:VOC family protein [Streptomyces sp. SBST2-5]|uniref:VOC family protein n=1 Tax=Streptomyces composti TaxID=2720025 RepID=A0ABX1AE30_9ACTN|nr:VOC family protein [Streptomyces composti]NJP53267.1 VOC family protein [Streptomyces composti]